MKKASLLFSVVFLLFVAPVSVSATVTFSEDTTIELDTTDTDETKSIVFDGGSTADEIDVHEDYMDITLEAGSDLIMLNFVGDYYFELELTGGAGATFPDCPNDNVRITSTGAAVVQVTIVAVDPECDAEEEEEVESSNNNGGGGRSAGRRLSSQSSSNDSAEEVGESIFDDVRGHWGEEYINGLYDLGVVEGRTSDSFAPNEEINRAEAIKIALLLFGYDVDVNVQNVFSDVNSDDWFYDFVLSGYMYAISTGYEDGTFRPGNSITRAEALTILLRAKGVDMQSGSNPFSDVSGHWAFDYIITAYLLDVVEGYNDGVFKPDAFITRAEFSKIAYLIFQL